MLNKNVGKSTIRMLLIVGLGVLGAVAMFDEVLDFGERPEVVPGAASQPVMTEGAAKNHGKIF